VVGELRLTHFLVMVSGDEAHVPAEGIDNIPSETLRICGLPGRIAINLDVLCSLVLSGELALAADTN
jgi:hypothetical protein